jgi:hypothetical protein
MGLVVQPESLTYPENVKEFRYTYDHQGMDAVAAGNLCINLSASFTDWTAQDRRMGRQ